MATLLRPLSLPSLALGGLLLASPASAAKAEERDEGPRASVVDVYLEDGALMARIKWPATQQVEELQAVSYDGKGEATVKTPVRAEPGRVSTVKLFGAVTNPWETGWARKLSVEDADGNVLAAQPYDVSLDCDGQDDASTCALTVSPGLASTEGVVHLSDDLDQAIATVRPEGDEAFDLVERVSRAFPELRGEAIVYADQVARMKPTAGPCNCTWQAIHDRNPAGYSLDGSARHSSRSGWNGAGYKHWMYSKANGVFLSSVHEISGVAEGSSQVTLRLSCSQLLYVIDKYVTVLNPDGTVEVKHIVQPVYGSCTSPCRADFNHQGRISGATWINGDNRPGNRAIAETTGRYKVDGVSVLDNTVTQGGSFDNTGVRNVTGYSSTGRVESRSYVRTVGRWHSAESSVNNGYAISIHATAACMPDPYKEVATWDFGSTRGRWHEDSLRQTIRDFFWQWYIPVNP